jgi:tRNA (guanine37-N1)-methyltransferase
VHIGVVTLFPELIEAFAGTSIVGRAREQGLLQITVEPLRRHGLGNHKSVDDTPYGGGSGMVMRVDCLVAALEAAEQSAPATVKPTRILLTPQGTPLTQPLVEELAALPALILVCGRYEGFDDRVRHFIDREVSLGDFVLAGGEIAAMAVIEACSRLLPGVLGNSNSVRVESFSVANQGLLEFPQFTRPLAFRGLAVPEVLRGGNHAEIEAWRRAQALERTRQVRPELLSAQSARQPSADRPLATKRDGSTP